MNSRYTFAMHVRSLLLAALLAGCGGGSDDSPLQPQGERISLTADTTFHVNPAGDDNRDCLSEATACQTMQATWDKIHRTYDTRGHEIFIQLADGVYTSGLNVVDQPVGQHMVHVLGNCTGTPFAANRANVVIAPPPGEAAFRVQDTAILSVGCLRIEGAGAIGFAGRQHVVIDISYIDYGPLLVGNGFSVSTIANFGGDIWISGNMHAFVNASLGSSAGFYVPVIVKQPVDIDYFMISTTGSTIVVEGAGQFVDGHLVRGQQYAIAQEGRIAANGRTIPGHIPGVNADSTGAFFP